MATSPAPGGPDHLEDGPCQDLQSRYMAMFRSAFQGLLFLDGEGAILAANQAAERILGFGPGAMGARMAGDPQWLAVHEDGSPFSEGEMPFRRALRTGLPVDAVVMGVCPGEGGERRWISVTASPLFREGAEHPHQVMTSFFDVTEARLAERRSRESEEKFRAFFLNLAEGVALHELVLDEGGRPRDYRVLDVNPAFQGHTGIDPATALGRLGSEVYGTGEPPYLEEYGRVALGAEPYAFETYFPPLDKHFRISVISPGLGQFATVFEDITERKGREEELKRKTAEMEQFTYMISHDLKSPLVTVRSFLGYLEQDLEQGRADRIAQDMGFMREATGRMGRLLEDLLEVSRVGRVVNPPVRVTFAELAGEALEAVAGAIRARGVEVEVQGPAVTLWGDRTRLGEIWQNLVENAVKYMGDEPRPRIDLGTEKAGAETVFFVRDNGQGIDPKFQAKVFGLFEKLDRASEGTGLGLALVKRIVELHGGRVWLESRGAGQGACFRFTLPAALKKPKV